MTWEEYYEKASYIWESDATKASQISQITNIEEADPAKLSELIDCDLDEKAAMKLLRKASKAGIVFTGMQITLMIDDGLDMESVCKLTITNDKAVFTPEEFIRFVDYDFPIEYLKIVASKLSQNLNADQLDELYSLDFDEEMVAMLAEKAGQLNPYDQDDEDEVEEDVEDEIDEEDDDIDEDEIDEDDDYDDDEIYEDELPRSAIRAAAGVGFLEGLSSLFSNKSSSRCTGNCASCPPHYGYRYGRWYYGHGHDWGCEFNGCGCRAGKNMD